MPSETTLRTIPFDDQDAICTAIKNHENFEIGGCQGRMDEAVLFTERAIGSEGMKSRIYTKGRTAALAASTVVPVAGAAIAVGIAAHNLATLNPDYEVMKRPVDKILRLTYVKDNPGIGDQILNVSSVVGQGITETAKTAAAATSEAAKSAGASISEASKQVRATASDVTNFTAETVSGISIWAIVGGAVVGVTAVAAAPFTGGGSVLGATTLLASLAGATGTAVAAGSAGAVAGSLISKTDQKKEVDEAYKNGSKVATAETFVMVKELEEKLIHVANVYKEQNKSNDFIICLFAVGISMAACDGDIHEYEKSNLKDFVLGASAHKIPAQIQDTVQTILLNPPDFEGAMKYVEHLDNNIWPVIDDILEIVSQADGKIVDAEKAFLQKWTDYKDDRASKGDKI